MATPTKLTTEYFTNPLGLGTPAPRLAWQLADARRGARQTAYQVVVASAPEKLVPGQADLWDSGQVQSDQSLHIPYAGAALKSRQRAYWTVRLWDHAKQPTALAPAAFWEMGLLNPADWSAQCIGHTLVGSRSTAVPAPYFRKPFTLPAGKTLRSARLYASALGVYEAYLNGQRIGADIFTPGYTDYRHRIQYQTYDVTSLLKPGANAVGAILGDGWYVGFIGAEPRQVYGDRPWFFAQLVLAFTDGSSQTIPTDASWKTTTGPILFSDFLQGEAYDARLDLGDFASPKYDDKAWLPVLVGPQPAAPLAAPPGPPVRRMMEITPIAPPRRAPGAWRQEAWLFDLGQNMVGRVRLKVSGPAGTTVIIRHAEMLTKAPNGEDTLYTANLRSARATDSYTLKGSTPENPEIYEPLFTFHGFRYIELSGAIQNLTPPTVETVTGIVLQSDTPPTGTFTCSDPLVNQLQKNIDWGQRGNFLEIPTDCPQRDERLGWTGDAQVFIRTAAYNMHVAPFFNKWLYDLADSQFENGGIPCVAPDPTRIINGSSEAAWADAFLICPWTIYETYGDTRILETHYPAFVRYANYLIETSRDYSRGKHSGLTFEGFGDWLAHDSDMRDNYTGRTPHDLLDTAFFALDMRIMARMAAVLGKKDDAAKYADLFEKIRAAFVQCFVTAAGYVHSHTQTAYLLALHFDLLPESHRAFAAEQLVDDIKRRKDHLSAGFIGSSYLNHVLTATGHLDTAYTLLFQKTCPSWLFPVTQGATTIWERWDGWTPDKGFQDAAMNSFNHYAYGAIGHWLYNTVAGLDTPSFHTRAPQDAAHADPAAVPAPAYKHILIKPQPPADYALTHAQATLETLYGRASSAWRAAGDTFHLDITIPPNTSATVTIPTADPSAITESGKPITTITTITTDTSTTTPTSATFALPAGTYHFAAPLMPPALPEGKHPRALVMTLPTDKPIPAPQLPADYQLREYQPGDEAEVIALVSASDLGPWTPASFAKILSSVLPHGHFVIVHKPTGKIVAHSMAHHQAPPAQLLAGLPTVPPRVGEVGWIAADRAHKGKGLGRAVVAASANYLRQAGYFPFLFTDDHRLPALKIYLALGFQPLMYHPDQPLRWKAIREKLHG